MFTKVEVAPLALASVVTSGSGPLKKEEALLSRAYAPHIVPDVVGGRVTLDNASTPSVFDTDTTHFTSTRHTF
jgi:hypothetical protein